ncbi:MAG: hypothetical protein KTR24_03400 [Saprospiraceae bacterium]|nr:hypothetical protein [Saprospiraceae bacterium]
MKISSLLLLLCMMLFSLVDLHAQRSKPRLANSGGPLNFYTHLSATAGRFSSSPLAIIPAIRHVESFEDLNSQLLSLEVSLGYLLDMRKRFFIIDGFLVELGLSRAQQSGSSFLLGDGQTVLERLAMRIGTKSNIIPAILSIDLIAGTDIGSRFRVLDRDLDTAYELTPKQVLDFRVRLNFLESAGASGGIGFFIEAAQLIGKYKAPSKAWNQVFSITDNNVPRHERFNVSIGLSVPLTTKVM